MLYNKTTTPKHLIKILETFSNQNMDYKNKFSNISQNIEIFKNKENTLYKTETLNIKNNQMDSENISPKTQYGYINNDILFNKKITLNAKGLYIYLASRCNSQTNSCYPTINRILQDLNIGKELFYKSIKELVTSKILKVTTTKHSNLYTLNINKNKPYTKIPTHIFINQTIPLKAKIIYTLYLILQDNKTNISFPTSQQVCNILSITKNTYFKYTRILKDCNLIETKQTHINGRFSTALTHSLANISKSYSGHNNTNSIISNNTDSINHTKNNIIIDFPVPTKLITKIENNLNTTNKDGRSVHLIDKDTSNKPSYKTLKESAKQQINYSYLKLKYTNNPTAQHILKIVLEVLTTNKYNTKQNNNNSYSYIILNKITTYHVETVISNIIRTNRKINNLPNYIETCLLNTYHQLKQHIS